MLEPLRATRMGARWTRVALCACVAAGLSYENSDANGTPRIHIKGAARLDAHAARAAGKLTLSGTLVDDAGQPISRTMIALTLARESPSAPAPRDALGGSLETDPSASVAMAAVMSECAGSDAPPVLQRADLLLLPTGESGHFCIRLALPTDRYVARLEARPAGYLEGTRIALPVDLERTPVTLRFDPERSAAALSLDEKTTTFAAVAAFEDDGLSTAAPGLLLSLSNELGTALATATTDPSGRALFHVTTARLGPPGRGELRLAFAGSAAAGASTRAAVVERRTRVDLVLVAHDARRPQDELRGGRALPGNPEEGIAVVLFARPLCGGDCTSTPTGAVEARVGGAVVGAAPLQGGEARLVMTFAMPSGSEVPVTIRYLPDAPWYQAAPALSFVQPVRGASVWSKAPLFFAAALVVAWIALARSPWRWKGASRAARSPPGRPTRVPHDRAEAEPRVDVLRTADSPQGWAGVVLDACDGVAVAGARVALERPGFVHREVIAETTSNDAGVFSLANVDAEPGDELVAEGPIHGALRGPVPPSGQLAIALSQRRRLLLDRLVAWARRGDGPHEHPEPTPGQIRRAATADPAITRWAEAVERAAYGGHVVDERVENEVEELAPKARPEIAARRR